MMNYVTAEDIKEMAKTERYRQKIYEKLIRQTMRIWKCSREDAIKHIADTDIEIGRLRQEGGRLSQRLEFDRARREAERDARNMEREIERINREKERILREAERIANRESELNRRYSAL